jgi:hypothetical protein
MTVARCADPDSLDVELAIHERLRIDEPDDVTWLEDHIATTEPVLVILDPLANLHERDENAAQQIGPPLQRLADIARKFHVAILVLHHRPKPSAVGRGSATSQLRGSTAIGAKTDGNLVLERSGAELRLWGDLRAGPPVSTRLAFDWDSHWASAVERARPGDATGATDREIDLLVDHVAANGGIRVEEATKLIGRSPNTAKSRLQCAVEQGRLVVVAEGRAHSWQRPVNLSVPL